MKIVLAPDSFKESLSAVEVCAAMQRGALSAAPSAQIVQVPLADGGEGTVQTLVTSTNGVLQSLRVLGPLGQPVLAEYGILGDRKTAVIEMAAASGLPLVSPEKRNPLHTTTYGTGELIRQALDEGATKMLIGIGGSATNDGGAGMAQALGARFYAADNEITEPMTGGLLVRVTRCDQSALDPRLKSVDIKVACDVDNPLLGERGAAAIYAPQKGADAAAVDVLEGNMKHFFDIIEAATQPVRDIPGAGAAGGLGAGLLAFLNGTLVSGINAVLDACNFDDCIENADLVITGEGKIDAQSAMGKTISGVVLRAAKAGVPVIAIGGAIFDDAAMLYKQGLTSMFSICDRPMTLEQAISDADHLVEKATERIVRAQIRIIR
jgi:glycerate 2-kinase